MADLWTSRPWWERPQHTAESLPSIPPCRTHTQARALQAAHALHQHACHMTCGYPHWLMPDSLSVLLDPCYRLCVCMHVSIVAVLATLFVQVYLSLADL